MEVPKEDDVRPGLVDARAVVVALEECRELGTDLARFAEGLRGAVLEVGRQGAAFIEELRRRDPATLTNAELIESVRAITAQSDRMLRWGEFLCGRMPPPPELEADLDRRLFPEEPGDGQAG